MVLSGPGFLPVMPEGRHGAGAQPARPGRRPAASLQAWSQGQTEATPGWSLQDSKSAPGLTLQGEGPKAVSRREVATVREREGAPRLGAARARAQERAPAPSHVHA